jgi:hypothetical protein
MLMNKFDNIETCFLSLEFLSALYLKMYSKVAFKTLAHILKELAVTNFLWYEMVQIFLRKIGNVQTCYFIICDTDF